jgi:hypothetical protein
VRDDDGAGLATGVLLFLVGLFLVSRTLSHDDAGFNLVDRIIAIAGGKGTAHPTGQDTTHIGPVAVKTPAGLAKGAIGSALKHAIPGGGVPKPGVELSPVPPFITPGGLPNLTTLIPGIPHVSIP